MKKGIWFVVGGCTGGAVPPENRLTLLDNGNGNNPRWTWLKAPVDRGQYGRLTTSFALIDGNVAYLIDQGLGVQTAASAILQADPNKVIMLQSHYHFDHIEGMHLNPLFYRGDAYYPFFVPSLGGDSSSILRGQLFDKIRWPISPPKNSFELHGFVPGDGILGDLIRTEFQTHPGGSAGFKINLSDGTSIVIATDLELESELAQWRFAKLVDYADVLIVECQLRQDEYLGQIGVMGEKPVVMKGWGHSTPEMLLSALKPCKSPPVSVLITHHDSRRDAIDLEKFEAETCIALDPVCKFVSFLREGQVIDFKRGR